MVSQYFLEFYTIKSDNLWAEGRDHSATTLSYYFDKEKKNVEKKNRKMKRKKPAAQFCIFIL